MFNFFKKKSTKELEKIRNFNEAVKTIKFFIATLEWKKAEKAIDEILEKETNAYKEVIENLDKNNNIELQKIREKLNKEFLNKQKKLNKLKIQLKEKKEKYENKIKKEKFNIKFKLLKKEVDKLIHTKKTYQALLLIKDFIKEHEANPIAIKYYNKEKIKLEKILQKEKEKKEKKDIKLEALSLIGETVEIEKEEPKENQNINNSFIKKIKEKFNLYKIIQNKIKEKNLIREIELLIKEEKNLKEKVKTSKLEKIHKGLIKELSEDILGYDFYGKILGANKISGDAFGFYENKKKYVAFIGDATGHGIKSGFIVTLLTRAFNKFVVKKDIRELVFEINNSLKQDLKSMNFITSIFFEIKKDHIEEINFVGLGHEPILIYRNDKKIIEKIIPGGLAAGIRIIRDPSFVTVKKVYLNDGDILLTYSDGVLEAKSPDGKYYGLDNLKKDFLDISMNVSNTSEIYDYLIKKISDFRKGSSFDDDLTILLLKRDKGKDVINNVEDIIKEIGTTDVDKSNIKKLKGKTRIEIKKELENLKRKKELENIVKKLKQLRLSGEILTLKEEAKRYIKQGYIHEKINYYFKKAIEHQQQYKINLKEERVKNKYNSLKELLKKGDYDTVIREAQDIILKDGNL